MSAVCAALPGHEGREVLNTEEGWGKVYMLRELMRLSCALPEVH